MEKCCVMCMFFRDSNILTHTAENYYIFLENKCVFMHIFAKFLSFRTKFSFLTKIKLKRQFYSMINTDMLQLYRIKCLLVCICVQCVCLSRFCGISSQVNVYFAGMLRVFVEVVWGWAFQITSIVA